MLEKILNNETLCGTSKLKKLLYKHKKKIAQCEICYITTWNNKKISLHLQHKDGNNLNNKLDNLQILCPNCHSQTDTFGGKNIKNKKIKHHVSDEEMILIIKESCSKRQVLLKCGLLGSGGNYTRINRIINLNNLSLKPRITRVIKDRKSEIEKIEMKYEKENLVYSRGTKIIWPDKNELEAMIKANPLSNLAKILGVSDNSIRKRAVKYNIDIRSISPWVKKY